MKISMNWINDFVDLTGVNIEKLIDKFTLSTAEVETIYYYGKNIKGVIVAEIEEIIEHATSNKLYILSLNTGNSKLQVVCGATNLKRGMKIVVAPEGSILLGREIKAVSINGVESYGVCCSEQDLGISEHSDGIIEISDNIPVGTSIDKVWNLEDIIFEIDNKSLTNRPDLWGHYGIAREIAALIERPLKEIPIIPIGISEGDHSISVENKSDVFRYSYIKIRKISDKVTPINLKIRLYYCGVRSIDLITDLTNYVMLDLGQPMHAYDGTKINKVSIKHFDGVFEFTTLDGVNRVIDSEAIMVCNEVGEPMGIAGIMGGIESEVKVDSNIILLESANFDGISIRKTANRLGLRTEASNRFEKILDPEMTALAIRRYAFLLQTIDENIEMDSTISDSYIKKYEKLNIDIEKSFIDMYAGIELTKTAITDILVNLGFKVELLGDKFVVGIPSWRATKDIAIKADIVEEITRIFGYDNIKASSTKFDLYPVRKCVEQQDIDNIKDILVLKFNLHEIHTYLWCDQRKWKQLGIELEDNISIINMLSSNNEIIRNSILPSLLVCVDNNKTCGDELGIFEIGKVVEGRLSNGDCNEKRKLGIVLYSRVLNDKELFYQLKSLISQLISICKHLEVNYTQTETKYTHNWLHPKNVAQIMVDKMEIGYISSLHPTVIRKIDKKAAIAVAEVDVELLSMQNRANYKYVEVGKYPGIDIDLSFTGHTLLYSKIESICKEYGGRYLKSVIFLNVYEKEEKTITLRLTFESNQRTLSMEEVQKYVHKIIEKMEEKHIYIKN